MNTWCIIVEEKYTFIPWEYEPAFIMIVVGAHGTHEWDCRGLCLGEAKSLVDNDDIGLSVHLLWSFWDHTCMFSAQFISINFFQNDYDNNIFITAFYFLITVNFK